jgi:beta-glucosidase
VVVGTDAEWETEGSDRESMALPGAQDELLERVLDAQPRTVVVVNAASPVSMPWAPHAASIVQAWFPGQEWGRALADVLAGDVSPSGRLPTTIPASAVDAPPMAGGPSSYPGEGGEVHYTEGPLVGYRWFDAHGIEPRYPFGHGLTYTTFEYGGARATGEHVVVDLANTGARAGSEVVQAYVRRIAGAGEGEGTVRPFHALAGFAKVHLDAGERRSVEIALSERAFQRWDVDAHRWVLVPGEYEVQVGASSRDARATARLDVTITA